MPSIRASPKRDRPVEASGSGHPRLSRGRTAHSIHKGLRARTQWSVFVFVADFVTVLFYLVIRVWLRDLWMMRSLGFLLFGFIVGGIVGILIINGHLIFLKPKILVKE